MIQEEQPQQTLISYLMFYYEISTKQLIDRINSLSPNAVPKITLKNLISGKKKSASLKHIKYISLGLQIDFEDLLKGNEQFSGIKISRNNKHLNKYMRR